MQGPSPKPDPSPADVAREAFRRLAARRIAPTPQAYRAIYEEISGTPEQDEAHRLLRDLAAHLAALPQGSAALGNEFELSLAQRDWSDCRRLLNELIERQLRRAAEEGAAASRREAPPPELAAARTAPTIEAARRSASMLNTDPRAEAALRDMLWRMLSLGVVSLLRSSPELAAEAEQLALAARDPHGPCSLDELATRLKQLCFRIEMRSGDMAEEHQLLLHLFQLLLENVGELLDDDSWLSGQVASVQKLLAGPLNHQTLSEATRSLKEVIYKQGLLKHSLSEAKVTVKNMMITFIDRLGAVATSTGDFHKKMDDYARQIGQARGINELNAILDHVMADARTVQTEALRSHEEMITARRDMQDAETKIQQLESQLEHMSELVREDALTGSLNRRGLEDVFERELARAERRGAPLCIAMLDLDDFKRLNDTYGHRTGDDVLIHLVRVIKETLRSMDVIARFGGEEFLIILPDTGIGEAMHSITRLQRELTKRIFMHEHARLLITFSAGVAARGPGEDQASLIKRADDALYQAKRAGKNRVVAAA